MTSATDGERGEFRNRPGRDLLVALVLGYLALAIPVLVMTQSAGVLASAGLILVLVPVGVLLAIMKADLTAALALALVVGLATSFFIRMPGFLRVPLLLALFAGLYYCTLVAGTVLD